MTGERPPGPPAGQVLPADVQSDPLRAIDYLTRSYGDVVACESPAGTFYVVNDPKLVRQMMTSASFPRTTLLGVALGQGSLSSEGPVWRKHRRLIQPGFERRRVETFAPLMAREAREIGTEWRSGGGELRDVERDMMRLTLSVVAQALFSTDVEPHLQTIAVSLTDLMRDLSHITLAMLGLPIRFSPERNRVFRRAMAEMDRVVYAVLEARRRQPRSVWPDDTLTWLLESEGDLKLDDVGLRDEVLTLLVAGHETTGTLLSWAWSLLAQNPDFERTWHDHLDRDFSAEPVAEDFRRPGLTYQLVQETMRLRPPVWLLARRVADDTVLSGWRFEKGGVVFVCMYTLHRREEDWPDAERFDPSRFAPERPRPDKFAFMPFGRGQHKCAGEHLATLEGQLVLALLGRQFRLRHARPDHDPKSLGWMTLRFDGGLPMRIEPR